MFSNETLRNLHQKALFCTEYDSIVLQHPPHDSDSQEWHCVTEHTKYLPTTRDALTFKQTASTEKAANRSQWASSFLHLPRRQHLNHYPMLARKELPGPVGDLGLSCSSYTGGGMAALEDCERGLESSS